MYRKGISALIVNEKNEFLLVNLISFEEKYYAIPGGGLEEGETLEKTSYREINEELGIEEEYLDLVGISSNPIKYNFIVPKIKEGKKYIGSERHFFAFRFNGSDEDIKLAQDEVRAYKWVHLSDLNKYLLFESQLDDTIEKIKELFGNNFSHEKIQ